jgi:hypothetical protein
MSTDYYDTSYPPQVLSNWNPATGATAGIPGTWTPAGSNPPKTVTDLAQGKPVTVTASPTTVWTTGQYVQTQTAGSAGRATWSGTDWVGGVAPLAEEGFGAPIPVDEVPQRKDTNMSDEPTPDNPDEPSEPETPNEPA